MMKRLLGKPVKRTLGRSTSLAAREAAESAGLSVDSTLDWLLEGWGVGSTRARRALRLRLHEDAAQRQAKRRGR